MLSRYMNEKFVAGKPLVDYDRYYAQDIIRDRRFFEENAGLLIQILNKNYSDNLILSGLWCSQGAGHTMNITAGKGLIKFNVTIPHQTTAWAIPPATNTIDIMKITEAAAQTNLSLVGIDTGGVTHNYAKLAFVETDGSSRAYAKKAGTYAYETIPDVVITFGTAAPTAYELVIAEFTSNGATLTFINNGVRQFMGKGREDVTIYTQADFNAVVERVSANRYQFKTGINSIFFKALTGGYLMSGALSGGDTWGNLETNGVSRFIMEEGAYLYFADLQGYIKVVTAGCILDGVYVKGLGSAAAAVDASFVTAAERVVYRNCHTSNRYTNVDFSGFSGGSYKSASYNGCNVSTLKCATAAKIIRAFYQCINMENTYIDTITPANGVVKVIDACENVNNLYVYGVSTANALTVVNASSNISNFDITTVTGTAGQATKGFDTCNQVSTGIIQSITNGIIIGCYSCSNVSTVLCTNFSNSSTDAIHSFYLIDNINNCRATTLTANNAACTGFNTCVQMSSCYTSAVTSTTGSQGKGYSACTYITSCYSTTTKGNGFDTCLNISSCYAYVNTLIGFSACTGVVNCVAATNSTYGFATCLGMYMNYSTGNTTKDYHTCKVDRSGAIAVAAGDTVALGCNDGVNYD